MTGERNCRNSCSVTEARHTTTGVSPAKLLFGREIRSKLPGVEKLRSASNESEVLERKQKGKDYADNLRGACESNLKEGDKVLLQKPKSDKLSPSFEATPYEVVNKQGGHVEIKSPAGIHYKRNVTHLQKYEEDKSQETAASNPKGTLSKELETSQEEEPRVSTQHYALRPRRNRQPERLKDYELSQDFVYTMDSSCEGHFTVMNMSFLVLI